MFMTIMQILSAIYLVIIFPCLMVNDFAYCRGKAEGRKEEREFLFLKISQDGLVINDKRAILVNEKTYKSLKKRKLIKLEQR